MHLWCCQTGPAPGLSPQARHPSKGVTVKIPATLVVTLPAAYMTAGQIFGASRQSGLALHDSPPGSSCASTDARVVINDPVAATGKRTA